MKERPILFSTPMVQALLSGTKTQTRRPVKPFLPAVKLGTKCPDDLVVRQDGGFMYRSTCPYGQVGDRLWVREAIRLDPGQLPDDGTGRVWSSYVADGSPTPADAWPWKRSYLPPMHCPRGLSRITLEVIGTHVERLHEISKEDARAEGITDGGCLICGNSEPCGCDDPTPDPRDAYFHLWESINGPESCASNPYVWVVEFKVVDEDDEQ